MTDGNMVLLHVTAPATSAAFYEAILGRAPVEASAGFVMFMLPSGLALGLWKRDEVAPASAGGAGGSEIGFRVDTKETVDALHLDWRGKGAGIVMPPADLDFGRSFVAADPDGHWLRVHALAEAEE